MTASERNRYMELVSEFHLRPIRTEKELDRAAKVIDSLIDRPSMSPVEQDYLNVLSNLVEEYENRHHPIAEVSDARMLQHLIEAKGVTQTEVSDQTSIANSTISAVLKGGRRLTREHIGQLAVYFNVEPTVFSFSDAESVQKSAKPNDSKRQLVEA